MSSAEAGVSVFAEKKRLSPGRTIEYAGAIFMEMVTSSGKS